jgi:hypothetical protein
MATESNTYNDYSVAATEQYPLISNFSFWLKPQVGRELFDVNPVETDFGEFMKMGLMKEVKGEEIIHHEANSRFDTPYVNTSATLAQVYGTGSLVNGDPAEGVGLPYIQLAAASHSPSSGPRAGKQSYPRVGQHIMFTNGGEWRIKWKRTSVDNQHRLYLQKVQSTMPDLSATIPLVAGQYGGNLFIVHTTSWGEGTRGMAEGLVPTSKTYTSWLQTFSNFYKITDFQENNETYPFVWNGKEINFTYPKGINDSEITFGAMIDYGLFLQNKDDGNLTDLDPESGEEQSVTTTQGYIQNLEANAQELLYDTTPTIQLFRSIGRYRRKMQQGKQCMLWHGSEFAGAVEDIVTQLTINGGTLYDRTDVDLNVRTIKSMGYTYSLKALATFDHPKFAGAPGFKYPYYFVVAPMDKVKDPKTGIPQNCFEIIYKKATGGGARGHYKMWQTGADAPTPTDAQVVRRIHFYTRMGMKTVGATKHILGKPVSI